jgi:hypothetical protein
VDSVSLGWPLITEHCHESSLLVLWLVWIILAPSNYPELQMSTFNEGSLKLEICRHVFISQWISKAGKYWMTSLILKVNNLKIPIANMILSEEKVLWLPCYPSQDREGCPLYEGQRHTCENPNDIKYSYPRAVMCHCCFYCCMFLIKIL